MYKLFRSSLLLNMLCIAECGDPPPTIDKATHPIHNIYLSPVTLEYTCDTGLTLLPAAENTVTCAEDGLWSGDLGKCYNGL